MKLKQLIELMIFACVMLMTAHEAQAFYNPSAGRWLSRDPIEDTAHHFFSAATARWGDEDREDEDIQSNLYLMLLNNPVSLIDPHGDTVLGADCVNCLGSAMGLDCYVQPTPGQQSLKELLSEFGWTCKGPTKRPCKAKKKKGVAVEDVIVVYIYDTSGFEKGKDPFKSPWPEKGSDFHAIRRCPDDKWRYIPNYKCPIGTKPKETPDPSNPDSYPWPDGKAPKERYCCTKKKNGQATE